MAYIGGAPSFDPYTRYQEYIQRGLHPRDAKERVDLDIERDQAYRQGAYSYTSIDFASVDIDPDPFGAQQQQDPGISSKLAKLSQLAQNINQQKPEPMRHKFDRGDRVVLIRKLNSNCPSGAMAPVWGYKDEYIAGAVTRCDNGRQGWEVVYVDWDNGAEAGYRCEWAEIILLDDAPASKSKKVILDTSKLDPLIIDHEKKQSIISVLKQHQNQDKLFKEWGLGEVLEYGKGMTFLFYGPPGTGKTWAAHCIAKAIGKELLTIGPAEIQTSEPGGANRAIQKAFAEIKKGKKILFLDECDSLITDRKGLGMIMGGEVNTLLTEIEKCESVCILATNKIDTLDEALERRISLLVEFPAPGYEQRKDIWKKLLPSKMPLGGGVDLDELGQYNLTGGQIKNVILNAARKAISDEQECVEHGNFIQAIQTIQKSTGLMGKQPNYHQTIGVRTGAGVHVDKELEKIVADDYDVDVDVTKEDKVKTN